MIGDTDITHLFQQETKLRKTNGASKLKKLSYDVTLKNESFAIQYKYSSKHLKCSAEIPDSGLPEKSIEIFVKLNECTLLVLSFAFQIVSITINSCLRDSFHSAFSKAVPAYKQQKGHNLL